MNDMMDGVVISVRKFLIPLLCMLHFYLIC